MSASAAIAIAIASSAYWHSTTALASDKPDHTEVDLVPVAGGDSDIGVGGGEFSAITRHASGLEPYAWRLESGAFLAVKGEEGKLRAPYQDYYVLFTAPHLIRNRLRLEVRPSFTEEARLRYYGVGNASQVSPIPDLRNPYYVYGRTHPTLAVRAKLTLAPHLQLVVGDSFVYNRLDVPANGRIAADRERDPRLREMLAANDSHAVDLFEYSIVYDRRDEETSTHRGQYHEAKLRLSPGGAGAFPYRYAQANVTLRAYVSPFGRYLTLAARVVGDVIVGDPPFYELPRFDDTFAIGGGNGVRGVPAQRYSGKVKAFANLEARSEIVPFRLFKKPFVLGAAAFFDGGRVWADTVARPDLDGSGIGLKYGVGGGLRLHQGESFVVRLDVAWSPDASPIGAYFAAGEIF